MSAAAGATPSSAASAPTPLDTVTGSAAAAGNGAVVTAPKTELPAEDRTETAAGKKDR